MANRDVYELTQENATVEIIPGTQTSILGYSGMPPGPTLLVDSARETVVRHINNSSVRTTTHLHGGHMRAGDDGHPVDYVNPGTTREYTYSNKQLPTTLWYHDDTMDLTGDQEVAIVIQDRTFAAGGSLVYTDNLMDELGDSCRSVPTAACYRRPCHGPP